MTRYIPFVYLAAAVLSLLELILGVYLVSPYELDFEPHVPSYMAFFVFTAAWSLIVLAYVGLSPSIASRIFHQFVALAWEWLTTLFWFGGSIALANILKDVDEYCPTSWCHIWRAAVVFGFVDCVLFFALSILDTLAFRRGRFTTTAAV